MASYALEFTFDSYLEYDQSFRKGWSEERIVDGLKKFAVQTYHNGDFYGFKAKSHDAIAKIINLARSAGLDVQVPHSGAIWTKL